jgi:hypothetical protein
LPLAAAGKAPIEQLDYAERWLRKEYPEKFSKRPAPVIDIDDDSFVLCPL